MPIKKIKVQNNSSENLETEGSVWKKRMELMMNLPFPFLGYKYEIILDERMPAWFL